MYGGNGRIMRKILPPFAAQLPLRRARFRGIRDGWILVASFVRSRRGLKSTNSSAMYPANVPSENVINTPSVPSPFYFQNLNFRHALTLPAQEYSFST